MCIKTIRKTWEILQNVVKNLEQAFPEKESLNQRMETSGFSFDS